MTKEVCYIVAIPEVNDYDNLEHIVFISNDLNAAKRMYLRIYGYKALYRINLDTEIEHGLMNEYMVCVESNVHWIPNISCTAASTSKLHAVFRKIVSTSVKSSKLHAVFRKITEDGKTFTSLVYVTKDHHIYDDYKQDNMYTITCV